MGVHITLTLKTNGMEYLSLCDPDDHWQADVDGNGTIDYSEFITATVNMNKMDREEHLYSAFQYFDKDGSG
mgnify:CR=1 FL=1